MEGTPPGDALPPPPQRATPARKGARRGACAGFTRPYRPHPGHTGRGTLAARSRGRAAGGGTAPDTRRPSQRWKAPPSGTPFRHPHSEQRRPARARAVGPVMGPHARTDRTRDTRDAEPWLPAPEDGRPREGQRLTPGAPHNGGRHPPREALPPHPQRATPARKDARCGAGAETPRPHRPHPGHAEPWLPAPEDGRPGAAAPTTPSQVGGNRDRTAPPPSTPDGARDRGRTRGGARTTWNGPTSAQCQDHARCARHTTQRGGERTPRERERTHTKRTRGDYRKGNGPSARNAQTAWNGVPASEGKGHPDGTARHTQRGTRGAGRGKQERHNTRYRPEPPPNRPRAPRTHRRDTAPAKAVVAHSATPQPLG